MADLEAKLRDMGFTEWDIRYLRARGKGIPGRRSLRMAASEGGLGMNNRKASLWLPRFRKKTGWKEDAIHKNIGRWLEDGVCPIESEASPDCPKCRKCDRVHFSLFPIERRCDKCFAKAIADFETVDRARLERRTSLGVQLAAQLDQAADEAEETGELAIPTVDQIYSIAAELAGGWSIVPQTIADLLTTGGAKQQQDMALKLLGFLEDRKKESTPLDMLDQAKTKPERQKALVDALLSQWYREHDRPALRDMILRVGGTPPEEDDEDDGDDDETGEDAA